jgi:hypothetical protein
LSIRIDKLSLNYIFRQTFPDMTKKETFHFTLVHKENLVTHLWFGVPFRHQVQWFFNAELPGIFILQSKDTLKNYVLPLSTNIPLTNFGLVHDW